MTHRAEPEPGLCGACAHAHRITSAKGSVFWRCRVADDVAGWPKYHPLPVTRCVHHRAGARRP